MMKDFDRDARPTSSPWGRPDETEELAPGIWRVDTASHGGLRLSRQRRAAMPAYLRDLGEGNWFEEDCAWSIVALVFPEAFSEKTGLAAHQTCRDWYPDEWERYTGDFLTPEQSYRLRERKHYAESADKWVAICAFGDWAGFVPEGKVGVSATLGGCRPGVKGQVCYVEKPERWFLVDAERYRQRNEFGYIVDPALDCEIVAPEQVDPQPRR